MKVFLPLYSSCLALTCFVSVELGVVVGKRGRDIPESEAESYVAGYGNVVHIPRLTPSLDPLCATL